MEPLNQQAHSIIDGIAVRLGATSLPDPTKAITLPYAALHKAVMDALSDPRPAMSEDEMLRRAREAAIVAYGAVGTHDQKRIRAGGCDDYAPVRGALAALRNLDKPLIDPLLLKAREIVAKHMGDRRWGALSESKKDNSPIMQATLEALRHD